ncbi:ferric reductase-like transmembrane domain-containing protein [Vibrio sp. PP-XX7]
MGYMAAAALLATRFTRIEVLVKGLDKGYAIHKKVGIGATIALIGHWLVVKSAHWLIEAGWLGPHHHSRTAIEGINWHALAKQVGEISFLRVSYFSAISLIQLFSYRNFKWTHKIAGLLMIAGIFHGVLLLDWNVQSFPMNLAIIVLSIGGLVGSVWSLTGQIGKSKK